MSLYPLINVFIGFGPADFQLGHTGWGAYRALGPANIPINWGSLNGLHVNSLLHPSLWDSFASGRQSGPIGMFIVTSCDIGITIYVLV